MLMKRVVLSLLMIGLLVFMPLSVSAADAWKINIPNTASSDVKSPDGTYFTKTYPVNLVFEANDSGSVVKDAKVTFTVSKKAARRFTCEGAGTFVKDQQNTPNDENYVIVCNFTSETGTSTDAQIGSLVLEVNADARDEDCTITYEFNGSTGTFNKNNPSTGASIPYGIIAGGLVLAAGAYFVTSKKTKLYNI